MLLQLDDIRFNEPDPEYRADPRVSQSDAKAYLRSPAHGIAREQAPSHTTPKMQVGIAVHHCALEPSSFERCWCRSSEHKSKFTKSELFGILDEAGTSYKKAAKLDELMALAFPDGVPVDKRNKLSDEDFDQVLGMTAAMRAHETVGVFFDPSQEDFEKMNEVSIRATFGGLPVKGRLDRIVVDGDRGYVIDLKSTDNASPDEFSRKAFNLAYDIQAAWYLRLAELAFPAVKEWDFVFVAIEREAPHGLVPYVASEKFLAFGESKLTQAVQRISYARATNDYHSYSSRVVKLDPPAWAKPLPLATV